MTCKAGSYIGAGAMKDGKGGNTAVEITVFPEAMRGAAEGFSQWNQGPDSTMTNGTVSQVVGTSNRVLTVTYKGGQQSVTMPDGTPVTTFEPADKTALTVRRACGRAGVQGRRWVAHGAVRQRRQEWVCAGLGRASGRPHPPPSAPPSPVRFATGEGTD